MYLQSRETLEIEIQNSPDPGRIDVQGLYR